MTPGAQVAVALVIGLAVVLMVLAFVNERRRLQGLRGLADRWGFAWCRKDPLGIPKCYAGHSALEQGDNRSADNVFHGERSGRQVVCFDYHFETHSSDSQGKREITRHHLSAAAVHAGVSFPKLLIRKEGVLDRLAEFAGFDDIDFDSAEFSRKFYVKCDDRRFAFDLLHARAIEFLLSRPADLTMELNGDHFLVHDGRLWGAVRYEDAVSRAEGLLDLIPEYLWQSLRERAR